MSSVSTDLPPASPQQQQAGPQQQQAGPQPQQADSQPALYCQRCGRPNDAGARFCVACGQSLVPFVIAGAAQSPQIINTITMVAPPPAAAPVVVVGAQQRGPGLVVRTLYFLAIGWWFGGFCLGVAMALMASVLGLPLGLLILNRLPQIMTLKTTRSGMTVTVAGASGVPSAPSQRQASAPTSGQRVARLVVVAVVVFAVLFVLAVALAAR